MSPLPNNPVESLIQFSRNNWALAIPTYSALAIICIFLYRLFVHPLAGLPGPLEAKISGTWRDRRYWRGTWHEDILRAHEEYGPVVRIGPNELSVVDEKATKLLYGHGSKSVKGQWYRAWDSNNKPGMFSTRSKEEHSFLRKRVSPAYTMSSILRYEQYIQPCLDLMMSKLKRHADQGHIVDLSDWTSWLAFDTVGTLAFGTTFGQLETESDALDLGKTIHLGFYLTANAGHWIGQGQIIQSPTLARILNVVGIESPFASFQRWAMNIIQERRLNSGKNERHDMLQHFFEMKSTNNGPATDMEVLAEAANIM